MEGTSLVDKPDLVPTQRKTNESKGTLWLVLLVVNMCLVYLPTGYGKPLSYTCLPYFLDGLMWLHLGNIRQAKLNYRYR